MQWVSWEVFAWDLFFSLSCAFVPISALRPDGGGLGKERLEQPPHFPGHRASQKQNVKQPSASGARLHGGPAEKSAQVELGGHAYSKNKGLRKLQNNIIG